MKSTAKPEYDNKFQEDLEKAQALSMETLALEEFRNRKLRSESLTINSSKTTQKSNITSFQSMSLLGKF